MYSIDKLKELLEKRLDSERFTHSLNVADTARELAQILGGDCEKAYLAGLLHDICKNEKDTQMLDMVKKCRFSAEPAELAVHPLWHAPAGAWYCENVLGIDDEEILFAVRYHTSGREKMSLLEKIIYLADLTSADRTYLDVDVVRHLSRTNADEAVFEGLRFTLSDAAKKKSYIPENELKAYNYYLKKVKADLLSEEK